MLANRVYLLANRVYLLANRVHLLTNRVYLHVCSLACARVIVLSFFVSSASLTHPPANLKHGSSRS